MLFFTRNKLTHNQRSPSKKLEKNIVMYLNKSSSLTHYYGRMTGREIVQMNLRVTKQSLFYICSPEKVGREFSGAQWRVRCSISIINQ